jgi:hypothetical protein
MLVRQELICNPVLSGVEQNILLNPVCAAKTRQLLYCHQMVQGDIIYILFKMFQNGVASPVDDWLGMCFTASFADSNGKPFKTWMLNEACWHRHWMKML